MRVWGQPSSSTLPATASVEEQHAGEGAMEVDVDDILEQSRPVVPASTTTPGLGGMLGDYGSDSEEDE